MYLSQLNFWHSNIGFSNHIFRRVRTIASVRLSEWYNSAPTGRNSMKPDIWVFLEKLPIKVKFRYYQKRITGTLHEHHLTFLIISRSIFHRTRNVSDNCCRGNQKAHFVFSDFFF